MKLEIKNFRGISSAAIPLSSTVLIAGPNGSGKTSIAMALAAASSGNAAPWADVTVKDAKANLLRRGASRGSVTFIDGHVHTTVNYPGGSVSGEMQAGSVSTVAAGIVLPAAMKPNDLSKVLYDTLEATPTKEDLIAEIGENAAEKVWPAIEEEGWDSAYKRGREASTKIKGQWEGLTGENYGSAKAKNWQPEGADAFDLSVPAREIELVIANEKSKLDKIKAQDAVNKSRVADLEKAAQQHDAALKFLTDNGIDPSNPPNAESEAQAIRLSIQRSQLEKDSSNLYQLTTSKEALEKQLAETGQELEAATSEMNALPKLDVEIITAPCPSCGTHLVVIDNKTLELPSQEKVSEEDRAARTTAIQLAVDKVNALQAEINTANNHLTKAINSLMLAKSASDQLAALPDTGGITGDENRIALLSRAAQALQTIERGKVAKLELEAIGTLPDNVQSIADAEQAVADAERALYVRQVITQAKAITQKLAVSMLITEVLSPGSEGLRSKVMAAKLAMLNEKLAEISGKAHWKSVNINDQIQVTYGGVPYSWQLSESERFRCNVTLQAAIADIDNSPIIVVDAADILDKKGRNGLIALAKSFVKPVVIMMTMGAKEEVPNLSKLGMKSFWINENGEVEEVA